MTAPACDECHRLNWHRLSAQEAFAYAASRLRKKQPTQTEIDRALTAKANRAEARRMFDAHQAECEICVAAS